MKNRFSLINALKNTAKSVVGSLSRVNNPLSGSELHAMYGLLVNSGEQSEYSTNADFEEKIQIETGTSAMDPKAPIYIFNEDGIKSFLLPPAGTTIDGERLDGALFDLNKILEFSLPLLREYQASKIIVPIAEASSTASFVGVNGHWVTLLIDIKQNKIQIIDSKSNLINKSELDTNLLKTIKPVLDNNKIQINAIERIHTGHQAATDLNSCGYLTLQYIKDLLANDNIKNLTTISDKQIQTAESFLESTKKSAAEFGKKNAYQDFYSYIKESGINVPLKQKQAQSNQVNAINIVDNYFSASTNGSPSLTVGESTDTSSPGQSNEDNQSEITEIESDYEIIDTDTQHTDTASINLHESQPDLVKSDEHVQIEIPLQVPYEHMPIPEENLGANDDTKIIIDTSPDTQENQLQLNQSSAALAANDTDNSIKIDIPATASSAPDAGELPANHTSLISEKNDTANDIKIDIPTTKSSKADENELPAINTTTVTQDEIKPSTEVPLVVTPTLSPEQNDLRAENNDVRVNIDSHIGRDDEDPNMPGLEATKTDDNDAQQATLKSVNKSKDDAQTNQSNEPVEEKQQGLLARLWSNVKYYVAKAWNFVTGLFSQTKPLDKTSPGNDLNNPVDNASIDGDQPDANSKPKLTRKGRLSFKDIGAKSNNDQTKDSDPSASPKIKR